MKLIAALVLNLVVCMGLAATVSVAFAFFGIVTMMAILLMALVNYPEVRFWD